MTFNLFDLVILITLAIVGIQFWQIRSMTEMAYRFASNYCKKHSLQLVSVARENTIVAISRGRPAWKCRYRFEFSANRDSSNSGSFVLVGNTVVELDVPAYPIN